MASDYTNTISILIAAEDEASAVIASLTDQIKAAQEQITSTSEETSSAVQASNEEMTSSFGGVGDAVDSLSADMKTSMTEMTSTIEAGVAEIVASNQAIIASFQEMATKTKESAATVGGEDVALNLKNTLGLGAIGGVSGVSGVGTAVLGVVGALALGVKSAADFQTSITKLYTTAGEQAPLSQLESAISNIADKTGISVSQLAQAQYYVSSAGYTQLNGTNITSAAAEAAKAEGANPADVANALTTAMVDYKANPNQATSFMNQLLTAASEGKTTLQDLSTALPTVLTTGSVAGLSLPQVLGSLGTLTAHGVTADQSAQDISALSKELSGNFTTQEISALTNYGLNPTTIASDFGSQGLTGTINTIMQAMMKSKTPEGLIMQSTLQDSQVAQASLKQMIAGLPSSDSAVKSLAEELENGSLSYANFRTESQLLPEGQQNLAKQIETEYNKSNSFNSLLTGGKPGSQTVLTALNQIFGQSDSAQAAEIIDQNMGKSQGNVNEVAAASKENGANIEHWADVQKNLNTQLSIFWQNIQTVGRDLGGKLLPPLTDVLKAFNNMGPGAQQFSLVAAAITLAALPIAPFRKALLGLAGDALSAADQIIANMTGGVSVRSAVSNVMTYVQSSPAVVAGWGAFAAVAIGAFIAIQSSANQTKSVIDQMTAGMNADISSTNNAIQQIENLAKNGTAAQKARANQVLGSALSDANAPKANTGNILSDLAAGFRGLGFAGGTNFAPGGVALVGEEGPELVNLPQGSQVIPAPQTQQILDSRAANIKAMGSGGSGGVTVGSLIVQVGNYMGSAADQQKLATQIWQAIQNIARQHGMAANVPQIGVRPA